MATQLMLAKFSCKHFNWKRKSGGEARNNSVLAINVSIALYAYIQSTFFCLQCDLPIYRTCSRYRRTGKEQKME